MVLVDSSVWIDYFRGDPTPQVHTLEILLEEELLAVGDLMLAEVLQGFTDEKQFRHAKKFLTSLDIIEIGGYDTAMLAVDYYRSLRKKGSTVRKTIDCLIATCCIQHNLPLLHNDRDFLPFVTHLGLRCAHSEYGSPAPYSMHLQQPEAHYQVQPR